MRNALTGPFVWTGDNLAGAEDWRFQLTPAMVAEIDAAVAAVKRRGVAWEEMRCGDFPLPPRRRWPR